MRVGEVRRRIPLATRELFTRGQSVAEEIARYLIALTRELSGVLDEVHRGVNDNDAGVDEAKMRRWLMDRY